MPLLEPLKVRLPLGHDGAWPSRLCRRLVEGRTLSRSAKLLSGSSLQCSNIPILHTSSASGFTLIEVVIAFAVAALIITAVSSGLVSTLRGEATAHRQATAESALRTLQTELWLASDTNNLSTNMPPGWALESETIEQGEGTNRIVWTQWHLAPESRRAFGVTLSTQQP